jgi:sulfide dehydrogenase [flavocytochrome c] flavoprotein subunit
MHRVCFWILGSRASLAPWADGRYNGGMESEMTGARVHRRKFLKSAMASAAACAFPAPLLSQGSGPSVVVIGGGFGGTSCARALRKADPRITVTLVEASPTYTAMPHSNAVIGGLVELRHQQFGYDKIKNAGVNVALSAATAIDPQAKTVMLASGTKLNYERLVVSPGIDFRPGSIQGYNEAAMTAMPPAYNDGAQVALLRHQLEAMEDGGTVVVSSPVNPARCPPAPYERASLIAHYLKTNKPRSKVIVLDAKESFTMQKLFEAAWQELYPGMIEWVGLSNGGALSSVDATTKTLATDFDKYQAAVASIIPPQKAGHVAELAGVADRTGWCPVDPTTFLSKLQPNIHVIGDAAIAGAMPRSASAAHSQAQICAAAIAALLAGKTSTAPTLTSSCYSLIAPDYAISQKGTYRPVDDQYAEADSGTIISPLDAPRVTRKAEAEQADAWYRSITGEVFG